MVEDSEDYARVFGQSPPTIIENRPESVVDFLAWLLPRERDLVPLIEHDLETRAHEGDEALTALHCLKDLQKRCKRGLAYDVASRALFLYFFGKKHGHIVGTTTFGELVNRAIDVV